MTFDQGQFAFECQVDSWVQDQLQNQSTSWHDLIANLPGVYPDVVLASARKQGLIHLIDFNVGSNTSASAKRSPFAYRLWSEGRLPTPHPLDACWWFADSGLSSLVKQIKALSRPDGRVVLLGAPTLFHALERLKHSHGEIVLIDSDREIGTRCSDRERVIVADVLRDDISGLSGDLIVADPPWYEPEVRSFLWTARILCSNQGAILISVPPVGSRPGIEQQWKETVAWASGLGLKLSEYHRGLLRYLSPPFERNALLAAGTPIPDEEWRQGDLAVFRVTGPLVHARPASDNSEVWDERSVGGVRFRVRLPIIDDGCDPRLEPLEFGEVLNSVSRRDGRRKQVDVWTSGNRVFRCSGRRKLLEILEELVSYKVHQHLPFDAAAGVVKMQEMMRKTISRIQEVVQTERQEYLATMESYAKVDAFVF